MLKRLHRRIPSTFQEAETQEDNEVENSPSESTISTLKFEMSKKDGEAVVPRKGQTMWCCGIACDAPHEGYDHRGIRQGQENSGGFGDSRNKRGPGAPVVRRRSQTRGGRI